MAVPTKNSISILKKVFVKIPQRFLILCTDIRASMYSCHYLVLGKLKNLVEDDYQKKYEVWLLCAEVLNHRESMRQYWSII